MKAQGFPRLGLIVCFIGLALSGCSTQRCTLTSAYYSAPLVGQAAGVGVGVVVGNGAGAGVGLAEGATQGFTAPFDNTPVSFVDGTLRRGVTGGSFKCRRTSSSTPLGGQFREKPTGNPMCRKPCLSDVRISAEQQQKKLERT